MRKAAKPSDADALLAPIVETFAGDGDVTLGKMFATSGLKVRGKVFAMIVKGRLVAKLPKDIVESLVTSKQAERFDPGHGRVMKEWVAIPATRKDAWIDLARQARAFVAGQIARAD